MLQVKRTVTRFHDSDRNKPWLWWLSVVLFTMMASYEIIRIPESIWNNWDQEAVLETIKELGMQLVGKVSGDCEIEW